MRGKIAYHKSKLRQLRDFVIREGDRLNRTDLEDHHCYWLAGYRETDDDFSLCPSLNLVARKGLQQEVWD